MYYIYKSPLKDRSVRRCVGVRVFRVLFLSDACDKHRRALLPWEISKVDSHL